MPCRLVEKHAAAVLARRKAAAATATATERTLRDVCVLLSLLQELLLPPVALLPLELPLLRASWTNFGNKTNVVSLSLSLLALVGGRLSLTAPSKQPLSLLPTPLPS